MARLLYYLLFFIILVCPAIVKATHIRAGEIIAELVSCQGYTYRFTVVGYTDLGSTVPFGGGDINFGDGEVRALNAENYITTNTVVSAENQIGKTTFIIEHTFPSPGVYTITFREFNRNAEIKNMANSVNTPFYVETQIVIDPLIGCNESPVLTNPPVDGAAILQTFLHNPGAYDPDGDSLAYKFVLPKKDRDTPVDGYLYPDQYDISFGGLPGGATNQAGTGPPTITLDSITGDLVWDAPNSAGEFNVAFIVEEWRLFQGEWIQLGYVTRDMQILVEDSDNEPPVLTIPSDTCIEAGTLLEAEVSATDPDNNDIMLSAFGAPFELLSSPATFGPTTQQPSPAEGTLQWQPTCNEVRIKPYQINFKAADVDVESGPSLADYKTWNVTVVGSAPTGLTAEAASGRSVNLNWDAYTCGNLDSLKIQIWRKADSSSFTPDNCQTGIPEGMGYELVATVDQSVVAYRDQELDPGVNYCYRLVAVFPDGALSYASEEACAEMAIDGPVITKVSITTTDAENGEIQVQWASPIEIDTLVFPPPYTYEVVRVSQDTSIVVSDRLSDTTFVDTGINTLNNVYSYQILLYDAAGNTSDSTSSAVASSVRLEPSADVGSITLNWSADVPWNNADAANPYHYIYRNQVNGSDPDSFVLIDSVNVVTNGSTYLDDGSFNNTPLSDETSYCYYIVTQGSYGNPDIVSPLQNNSQRACAQPNDTIPPCMPVAFNIPNATLNGDCAALTADCNQTEFQNTLVWNRDTESACDNDIRSFNIYFSDTGDEGTFNLVANTTDTFYVHGPLTSLAGCYRISSVDRSGNESELSEPVCNDNCPVYELPNVFTPDGNAQNATFRPFKDNSAMGRCPRFVESVIFRVYNRWGKEIYTYNSEDDNENGIYINWDGRLETGQLVSAGTYYYTADVTFIVLDPAKRNKTIKGWVQVLYSDPFIEE